HAVRVEAEEIASEAFVKAWQSRANFDTLPKVKSFLYTVVRNRSLDALRRTQARGSLSALSDTTDVSEMPGEIEQAEMVRAEVIGTLYTAIQTLPERPREIILMAYRDGLSHTEIAERLQITESTVRTHKQRAIELLRIALEGKFPGLAVTISTLLTSLFSGR
ncbi:MAG: sigma-70 family RNA polymerase sigma factor, partial [Chitinophagaceae bacterium]|nr:sigma-70 family RNA polymerase sigma factor [Chitinophagaceae bacterium]